MMNATFSAPNSVDVVAPGTTTSASSKLKSIMGDGSFEQLMKERAKIRKEKDEHSIAEIRVQLTSMENALSAEIKRRVDLNRSMERQCQAHISSLQTEVERVLDERTSKISSHLASLEEKVLELNQRLEEEKVNIPRDIEQKGAELQDILRGFQDEFSTEKRDRLNREGRILKQLHDFESHVNSSLEDVTTERDEMVQNLRSRMEERYQQQKAADSRFQKLIESELGALKLDIKQEISERKKEDDEIVEALNRYTKNLQSSLAVISSVEE